MEGAVAPAAGLQDEARKTTDARRTDSGESLAATEMEDDSIHYSDPPLTASLNGTGSAGLSPTPHTPEEGSAPLQEPTEPAEPESSTPAPSEDETSRLSLKPPDEGTPAAEALAANAAIPALRSRGLRAKKPKFNKLTRNLKKNRKQRNFQGNVIKGEHEQYTLTIGMMLGIRVAVGRPQQMDDLSLPDFMQVDKYVFPPRGCNKPPHRTPPHHLAHEFKFKDYAPKIFHRLRQLFGIDSASYMLSVCGNYNYLEFMSNSKSGQFFFYTHDGRFMIKTQTPEENKFLRKILPHYYQYVSLNPDTLLTRFYGMHRVKMRHLKRKMHFVIMHSVFDTKERIYRIYDLKGSTVGRSSGPSNVRKEGVVYKDLDLVDDKFLFHLGPKRQLFMEQLEKDATFLASLNIMDYSLLVGIHDRTREDSVDRGLSFRLDTTSGLRRAGSSELPSPMSPHVLEHVRSEPPRTRRELSQESSMLDGTFSVEFNTEGEGEEEDDSDYDSDSESDDDIPPPPSMMGATSSQLSDRLAGAYYVPTEASMLRCATTQTRLTHRRDHGVQSRNNDGTKGSEVYFVGIIDILQQYNAFKRAETFFKSFKYDRRQISAVDPRWYAQRFVDFLRENTD